jgi:hypothetical protein
VNKLHSGLRDIVAPAPGDIDAVELHPAAARPRYTHEAFQGRTLAGAVATQECHDLVALDTHRHIEQDVRVGVIGIQALDLDQAHAAITPRTPPS